MNADRVTIRMGGDLTIVRISQVFAHFTEVLKSLDETYGANVQWMLDGLDFGSAAATAKAIPLDDRSIDRIPEMCNEYLQAAKLVANGDADTERPLHRSIHLLCEFASEATPVSFETNGGSVVLRSPPDMAPTGGEDEATRSFGTVRGRVETLSHRGKLSFRLYELLTDKAVHCSIEEEFEDSLRQVWGRVADVSGMVSRDTVTGRPLRIRGVTSVDIVEEGDPHGYLRARGALSATEPAEILIGKMRDG